jgi:hypothetical protein
MAVAVIFRLVNADVADSGDRDVRLGPNEMVDRAL